VVNQLSHSRTKRLDFAFAALAHPARRHLLRLLRDGPTPVTTLAASFSVSLPAVSKHLTVLERAKLVRIQPNPEDGRVRICSIESAGLDAVTEWVSRTRMEWERRLDAMERLLARTARREAR
jgi:DNA-binding transcriptional ArsR family regulator